MPSVSDLAREIERCDACPRLRKYCAGIAQVKRRAYAHETYWGRPIPGFGDPRARLVVMGLAPAAHGANRTGRIFTGDRSGEWLYRALHQHGFANQAESVHRDDGLKLSDAYVTCAARCAPPQNRPTPQELKRCATRFLAPEIALLKDARVYLALGQIGLDALWPLISSPGERKPKFGHGIEAKLASGRTLLLSYHPSQQNTFTGRLTPKMWNSVFARARELLGR